MNSNSFFYKYKSIIAFLILEILALVSFTFGNINDVLFLISSAISLTAFVFAFTTNVDKKDYYKLIPVVAVLFIVSGIAAFGGFSHYFADKPEGSSFHKLSLSNLATFMAIPSFFSLGFFTRRLGEIKIEHVLMAVGFGFAAIVLIGMFATWINYGFFYSLIYKIKGTPYYYYNGTPYNVTEEMSWLVGFNFNEVSLQYGGLFAVICAAYLPALMFVDRKKDRNFFISIATIGGIGALSLITVPNYKALIVVAIASLFAFIYKFLKEKKTITTIIKWAFVGVVGLGVLFFALSSINAALGFKFTGIFNRVFVQNRIMLEPSKVFKAAFDRTEGGFLYNLFGFDREYARAAAEIGLESIVKSNTGIFEVQIVKEVGIIGAIIFMCFLISMIYFVSQYVKEDNDSAAVKSIIVVAVLAFFIYSSLYNDIKPLTHETGQYMAFFRSAPLMIIMFFLGLTYFAPKDVKFNLIEKEETK